MKLFTKTFGLLVLLSSTFTSFGISKPEVREVIHHAVVGETFSISIPERFLWAEQESIKNIGMSGIIECKTDDFGVLDRHSYNAVNVTFKALDTGKVLLFSDSYILNKGATPFGNKVVVIKHYVVTGRQYCCLPPSPTQ